VEGETHEESSRFTASIPHGAWQDMSHEVANSVNTPHKKQKPPGGSTMAATTPATQFVDFSQHGVRIGAGFASDFALPRPGRTCWPFCVGDAHVGVIEAL